MNRRNDFRGISLLAVLSKLYMACLASLAESCPKPALWNHCRIIGFVSNKGTEQITAPLQLLMARYREWGLRFNLRLLVLSCDVLHVSDQMSPALVVQALLAASGSVLAEIS